MVPFIISLAPAAATPPGLRHAVFAARVQHWPFNLLVKHAWETKAHEAQFQLLERQLRFLTALHVQTPAAIAQRLSIELRYIRRPDTPGVACVLLGKAAGATDEAARAAAQAWWELIADLTPLGYQLQPAETQGEFSTWAGYDLGSHFRTPAAWAFAQRRLDYLPWTDVNLPVRHLPVIYPFNWRLNVWEGIWAALSRATTPALVVVTLRLDALAERETLLVGQTMRDLEDVAKTAAPPLNARAAEALAAYQSYLYSTQMMFATQVAVLGTSPVRHAVRSALSGPDWAETTKITRQAASIELVEPTNEQLSTVQANLAVLEINRWPLGVAPEAYERLRRLTESVGASTIFRWPLLQPAGLPGLQVGEEIAPPTEVT